MKNNVSKKNPNGNKSNKKAKLQQAQQQANRPSAPPRQVVVWVRKYPPTMIRPVMGLEQLKHLGTRAVQPKVAVGSGQLVRSPIAVDSFGSIGHGNMVSPAMKSAKAGNTGLSACATWYAKALSNPFGEFEELPCVPSNPAVPSYRYRLLTRGTWTTGTTGNAGFIAVAPYLPYSAGSGVILSSSSALFLGTSYAASGTAGTTTLSRPLPFSIGAFSGLSCMQAKLVGAGLRVKNTSPVNFRGGQLFGTTLPSDNSLLSFTAAQVTSYPGTQQTIIDADNDWSVVIVRPTDVNDLDYNDSGIVNGNQCIGFLAVAPAGNVQTYAYEYVEFWEYIGSSTATGERTPGLQLSHADEVGLARVTEAGQEMPTSMSQTDINKQMAEGVVDAIAHSDSTTKTAEALMGVASMPLGVISGLVGSLTKLFAL